MTKISSFLYCTQAAPGETGFKIDNPLHMIIVNTFPSLYSFTIVFNIIGIDFQNPHTMKVILLDSNENVLLNTGDLPLDDEEQIDNTLPSQLQGIMGGMDFKNINFETQGIYNTKIFIDEIEIGTFPIAVIKKRGE